MPNRLAGSTSPYLLQHADNPVDWWEWGPEAFEEARRRDVPVLVSVGYAACHWCHVMAAESFEDDATAGLVNDGFVAVKVDREERPDVDAVYMRATTALTRHGGWPMTVFTTPDGRPFHAGTYFPPDPRPGMPSFTQVLDAVGDAWQQRRDQVEATADRLARAIGGEGAAPVAGVDVPTAGEPLLPEGLLRDVVTGLLADEDTVHGGFGGAPKFPPSAVLAFLLVCGDDDGYDLAARTLRAMARSGMYDQVEGGFARYAVDAGWVVPHFEKMLYDNAQLARVYARWSATTTDPADAATGLRVAVETCTWLLERLGTADGGLASALDADTPAPAPGADLDALGLTGLPESGLPGTSHGVEGLTYVWTPASLVAAAGEDDGRWAADALGVSEHGSFEGGTSTLRLTRDLWDERTRPAGVPPREGDPARWERVRARLREVRSRRPQPARDDKVVAAWNGLAVAALAETGLLAGRPDLVAAARRVATVVLARHGVEGDDGLLRLRRVSRDGTVGAHAGVLEDYGDLAAGLLALHGVDGDPQWADAARRLVRTALARFVDPATASWQDIATDEADPALARALGGRAALSDPADNAHPSGPSAATGACLHVAALFGDRDARAAAERALRGAVPLMAQAPRFAGWWLHVAAAALDGPREVAVVGPSAGGARGRLQRTALSSRAPGLVLSVGEDGAEGPPLLADRTARDGRATAYVCRGFVCDAPTDDVHVLARQLARA
ncbi:thioredoxin domain-containing protein [Aquipuribacter nitratireducens]|uniref:Thioredoxin domain-containing protein n=1 Tax=Aquipuribacter nitratireducens TaxID=650104 RepID=A0ABW0GIE7_9MICO